MSKITRKQLCNPFSTGNGGSHFEAHVQASFVVLMLTGGYAPCLPCWPINEVKLQRRIDGYDTDDLIIFVEKPDKKQKRKIIGQVKHFIKITKDDTIFGEVMQAAWNDYNNANLFNKNEDIIVLITGPLRGTDTSDVRWILAQARTTTSVDEFFTHVNEAKFSSRSKKNKLNVFQAQLMKANGIAISNEELYLFLKHFHLITYDLGTEEGVVLSLLHSHISQFNINSPDWIWSKIVGTVQTWNQNAGSITFENLPEDLQEAFQQNVYKVIPTEFSTNQLTQTTTRNWSQYTYASDLVIASLIGAWDENSTADIEIICQLIDKDFTTWLTNIREILQQLESPLAFKNGKWRVVERRALWQALGTRLFNNHLDNFKQCIITVLTERDPEFDLPLEERDAAAIHGKRLEYSSELRKGMAEGLALLGNQSNDLINCSQNKPKNIAALAVCTILENENWILWGSLNNLHPLLAEAAPEEFLNAVERLLHQNSSPLNELFTQKSKAITGENYLTGVLWALETLAWDERFLVRVAVIFGEMASKYFHDNLSSQPINSLETIFMPWFPQTMAPIKKRKVALQTLHKQVPEITWKLLLNLLPNQHQSTSELHKPTWRAIIPENWENSVTIGEYWEQVFFYSGMIVSIAECDIGKLTELIDHLDHLPQTYFDQILKHLSSETISNKPENERLALWIGLSEFTSKHRHFSNAKWALSPDVLSKIETVTKTLAPSNPLSLHRPLFSNKHHYSLYGKAGNLEEQQKKLTERRQQAITDILSYGGINVVIEFAKSIESPFSVGYSLGMITDAKTDTIILPTQLKIDNTKLSDFARGYVWSRQEHYSWAWADSLDKSNWTCSQIGQFLSFLPFTEEAWERATLWLDNAEGEYWKRAVILPDKNIDLNFAIHKLIKYNRPNAAVNCLSSMKYWKQQFDVKLGIKTLRSAVSSPSINTHNLVEIIKTLQDDPQTEPDDLFQVEWAYLPLLNRYNDASPKLLEQRLVSDPSFFCYIISLIYPSKNEVESKKKPSKQEKSMAENAWLLLREWQTPPGMRPDGTFSDEQFRNWISDTKEKCSESGHLDIAFKHIGNILIYCPSDPNGLWFNQAAAEVLNAIDAEAMRDGFYQGIFNSRGVHIVDPTAKPEYELAAKYEQQADDIENAGYQRFAATLRDLADTYKQRATEIIDRYRK